MKARIIAVLWLLLAFAVLVMPYAAHAQGTTSSGSITRVRPLTPTTGQFVTGIDSTGVWTTSGVNADNIASGTLPLGRLPATVGLTDTVKNWSAAQNFNGGVTGNSGLASFPLLSYTGRLSLCETFDSASPKCAHLSAYGNSSFPLSRQLTMDLVGDTNGGFHAFGIAGPGPHAAVDARFEVWVGGTNDGLITCGGEGVDCTWASQWNAWANGGNGGANGKGQPRNIHIGLATSSGVLPIEPAIRVDPLMNANGSTVDAARVAIGPVAPSAALHIRSKETSTTSIVRIDGDNNSNGASIMWVGVGGNKYTRVTANLFQILNNAYSAAIFQVDDSGNGFVPGGWSAAAYSVGGNQVVGARQTGWTAGTGTANKAAFATYSAGTASATYTQAELQAVMNALQANSQRIKALEDMARTHGLIN